MPRLITTFAACDLNCRTWFAKLAENAEGLVRGILPPSLQDAVPELAPYLLHSFGNSVRLDYGTGHETTFVCLLYCLAGTGRLCSGCRVWIRGGRG
jgi:serine/threonine-protein phosphatase 2A activator